MSKEKTACRCSERKSTVQIQRISIIENERNIYESFLQPVALFETNIILNNLIAVPRVLDYTGRLLERGV